MQRKKISILVILVFLLFPFLLLAGKHYEYVESPKEDIYFGHISWTDVKFDGKDPLVLRDGERSPETAVLNFPLTAGDTIRTTESRRCEIQFDTGTIIRLDYNTELKIETILAQSLSSRKKLTNLVLNRGQMYIMYKKYNSREVFQVLTANAAVKMDDNTVGTLAAEEGGETVVLVKLGKALVLYGADADHLEKEKIEGRQEVIVSRDHKLCLAEYTPDTEFELWNEEINANFQKLHMGKSFIPAPLKKYPEAVIYFAQKYSNIHGEWMWNSLYGYVWRPSYNDYFPWGSWQPYLYGQWREVNGQLFWVPEEGWGWVPYHLGLWVWDKKYGWVWIPGTAFAPAWVAWDSMMGYYAWRPWSMLDWYYPLSYYDYCYYMRANFVWRSALSGTNDKEQKSIRRWINKDQLKKRASSPYSLPKKLKNAYNRSVKALRREDVRVISPLKNFSEQLIAVKRKDLNAARVQEKNVKLSDLSRDLDSSSLQKQVFPEGYPENSYSRAVWTFRRNRQVTELRALVISSFGQREKSTSHKVEASILEKGARDIGPTEKFVSSQKKFEQPQNAEVLSPEKARTLELRYFMYVRDWNPDVQKARRMGVGIIYSSRHNEVRCPELGLTSKNVVVSRSGMSSRGGFYSSHSGGGSGSGSSSGSSGSSSSSGSSRGSSGGHSHSGSHSRGGSVRK